MAQSHRHVRAAMAYEHEYAFRCIPLARLSHREGKDAGAVFERVDPAFCGPKANGATIGINAEACWTF